LLLYLKKFIVIPTTTAAKIIGKILRITPSPVEVPVTIVVRRNLLPT